MHAKQISGLTLFLLGNTREHTCGSPTFNVVFLIFSGILINTSSLPTGTKWLADISPIKWGVTAAALNEFTGATFTCEPGQPCIQVRIVVRCQ